MINVKQTSHLSSVPVYIASRFNSTTLKFHEYSKGTNCDGFNFKPQENQLIKVYDGYIYNGFYFVGKR